MSPGAPRGQGVCSSYAHWKPRFTGLERAGSDRRCIPPLRRNRGSENTRHRRAPCWSKTSRIAIRDHSRCRDHLGMALRSRMASLGDRGSWVSAGIVPARCISAGERTRYRVCSPPRKARRPRSRFASHTRCRHGPGTTPRTQEGETGDRRNSGPRNTVLCPRRSRPSCNRLH